MPDCHGSFSLPVGVIYAVEESEIYVDGNASFVDNSAGSFGGEKQHGVYTDVDSEVAVTVDVWYIVLRQLMYGVL